MVTGSTGSKRIARQASAFAWVGVVAAIVHYGLLVGLVEVGLAGPVTAALVGYVAGGIASYGLNRRYTYESDRPHAEAGWRFALVAGVGFVLTGIFMHVFAERLGVPYLAAQILTTGIVLVFHFIAHKVFTFRA